MAWSRARFKENDVWVELGDDGKPILKQGLVNLKYQKQAAAKVYRGASAGLSWEASAESWDGVDPGGAPTKPQGSGFGSAGSRTAAQAAAAAEAASDLLKKLGPDIHVAYTDGACKGNPGPAGSGVYLVLSDGRKAEASRALGQATNNVGELGAIELTLDLLDEAGVAPTAPVAVLSDSSYVRGVLILGWKAKANVEQVAVLRTRLKVRSGVRIYWVAGHAGVAGNERADVLANLGSGGKTATRWT
jgi:ribonuclease HI